MGLTFSPWLIWFLVGIAVMLAELAVPGFVIFFFGLGCWGAAVAALLAPDSYSIQVFAFLIVSVASLLTLRKVHHPVREPRQDNQHDHHAQQRRRHHRHGHVHGEGSQIEIEDGFTFTCSRNGRSGLARASST